MVDTQVWSGQISGAADFVGEQDVLFTGALGPQPAAHTVLLAAEKTSSDAPSFAALPAYYAECTMKAGQFSAKLLCDWRGQFSAVFQSLQVRAIAYSPLIVDDASYGQPQGTFRHTVLVGYGGWNASRPLTYTGKQRLLGDSGGAGFGATVIQVPAFGRRFFPRMMHFLSNNWDIVGAVVHSPLVLARLSNIAVTIDANYQGVLTERAMMDGIDVAGGSLITLSPLSVEGAQHLVTPVFELGL